MKRRLLNLVTAASLVLCLATAVLWVVSFFTALDVEWRSRTGTLAWSVSCSGGVMGVARSRSDSQVLVHAGWFFYTRAPTPPLRSLETLQSAAARFDFRFIGFAVFSISHPTMSLRQRMVLWPCWIVVLLTAVLPCRAMFRRAAKAGHCPTCGYDLRATPDRCPECGAVPTREQADETD